MSYGEKRANTRTKIGKIQPLLPKGHRSPSSWKRGIPDRGGKIDNLLRRTMAYLFFQQKEGKQGGFLSRTPLTHLREERRHAEAANLFRRGVPMVRFRRKEKGGGDTGSPITTFSTLREVAWKKSDMVFPRLPTGLRLRTSTVQFALRKG